MPGLSQQVFHLFDGQDRNKNFDSSSLLTLVPFAAKSLLDLGERARELFREVLNKVLPLHWPGLDRHLIFPHGNEYIHRGLVLHPRDLACHRVSYQ